MSLVKGDGIRYLTNFLSVGQMYSVLNYRLYSDGDTLSVLKSCVSEDRIQCVYLRVCRTHFEACWESIRSVYWQLQSMSNM